jgi:hypothetical protein
MTAAQFELLTTVEVECLLRRRLRAFIDAGATPSTALLLAAQVEISEEAAVALLRHGHSGERTLRLLHRVLVSR